jgi:putative ABC transport system permease protein
MGGLDRPTAGSLHYRHHDLTAGAGDASSRVYRRDAMSASSSSSTTSFPSLTARRERRALVTELADARDGARARRSPLVGLADRAGPFPRRSSPAASSSASPWPAPLPSVPMSCCVTSRPAPSTASPEVRVLEALASVNRALGTTTIVITHNASIAAMAASRRAVRRRPHRIGRGECRPPSGLRGALVKGVSSLDMKLVRDMWRRRGQVMAIALVITSAVATLIMALGALHSLSSARAAYYERYRFADMFVSLKRAPDLVAGRLRGISGVARVETRVTTYATLDIPGMRDPVRGLAISLPEDNASALNALVLRVGRFPDPARPGEVIVHDIVIRQGPWLRPRKHVRCQHQRAQAVADRGGHRPVA